MALSRELVTGWLVAYMFEGDPEGQAKAEKVATYFSGHNLFKTHSRRIGLREIKQNDIPLNAVNVEKSPELHRCILRLYAAISHTFAHTGAYKMCENSQGEALFRMIQVVVGRIPTAPTSPPSGGKKKKK